MTLLIIGGFALAACLYLAQVHRIRTKRRERLNLPRIENNWSSLGRDGLPRREKDWRSNAPDWSSPTYYRRFGRRP